MRLALLALALILSTIPYAAANEAPVAVPVAPAEARLNEPIVFSSASYDPDGTIVSTTWEFSDGRMVSGASVTKRLDYPGVHTITLRVTDNLGALTAIEFPVLVHAPTMHGRAYALRVGEDHVADTGDFTTTQHTTTLASVGDTRFGALRFAALDGELRTLDNRAIARATVEHLYIPVPVGYILVTGIESYAVVGCDYPTLLSARFTQVRLNDSPLVPPGEAPPNTAIALPGVGLLELNVQEPVGERMSVVALRFTGLDGSVVEVAHAEGGASHCPFA